VTPSAGDPTADGRPDAAAIAAELVDRFAAADRHGAVLLVRRLLEAGSQDETIGEAVGLAQREVGHRWQSGRWTITQEHAATAVAEAVLALLDDQLPAPTPVGRVAVVAAEGEWHALPVRLAAHACSQGGLEVVLLGTGIPATDVARSLPTLQVDALAVSVTVPANLVGAARTVAAGRAAELPVLLGGFASSPARAAAIGADAHAETVAEGTRTVRAWLEEGVPPPAGPAELDHAGVAALRADHSRLLADAFGALEDIWATLGSDADEPGERTLEDLGQLLDHLAAAVLLDEPELFTAQVGWLGEVHRGRDLPPALLPEELDALDRALEDHDRARALLRRASRR
jgi:MerR family transcriptional regulator, light-induced transcriptional regulator